MYFDELTMVEFERRREAADGLVIWPVGIIEEHGPHLPLATDSLQGEWVCEQLASKTGGLLAPPLRYGLCQSTRNFPGSISLSFDVLRALAREVLGEFVRQGLDRIVVISGHAGSSHMQALRLAAQAVLEGWHRQTGGTGRELAGGSPPTREPRLMVLSDWDLIYGEGLPPEVPPGDGHAGAMETARIQALRPELVKGTAAAEYPPAHDYRIVQDPQRFFPSGVMGDPGAATPELGHRLNGLVLERLVGLVEGLRVG